MNNVKVQTKLIIVMLTTIVALVLCAIISSESMKQLQSKALETLEADERASYDEQIKQQVDNVISLCQTIYDQYQAGVYTEEEAKKLAADEIRQLRYGEADYYQIVSIENQIPAPPSPEITMASPPPILPGRRMNWYSSAFPGRRAGALQ